MDGLDLGSVLLAIGGTVAAGGTMLIVVRNARAKGRKSAIAEADALEAEIADCRARRIADERTIYELRLKFAEAGLDPDGP